jgi:hypothetical protein
MWSSSINRKHSFILVDKLSFYYIVIGCSHSIIFISTFCFLYTFIPVKYWYIYACFLAAFYIVWRWRLKVDDLLAPTAVVKLIFWMWVGEMYSICSSWFLRSVGNRFDSSGCLNGLGIRKSDYLGWRLLEMRLDLRFCLCLGVYCMRGELLKLFI